MKYTTLTILIATVFACMAITPANLAFQVSVEVADAASDEKHIELAGLKFKPPERLKAGGKIIEVKPYGCGCPGMGDVDGDGKEDLLVGHIKDGKIMLCKNLGQGKFAEPDWIKADGKIAVVPGVW